MKIKCNVLNVRHLARIPWILALAMPVAAAAPPPSFAQRLLAGHNAARATVGTRPLMWSDDLARSAKTWADTLARSGRFDHAKQEKEGENLWMGTKSAYSPEDMVGSWIDERSDYLPGVFPKVSKTGNWADVGHYTQAIWHSTTQVGCALSSNSEDDVLVCRYFPPGNWIGQRAEGDSRVNLPPGRVKSRQVLKIKRK